MTNSATIQKQLHAGVDAVHKNQVDEARRQFIAVIRVQPDNIPALLWLAFIATDPAESIHLLQRVLELEPHNEKAQAGLRWAKTRFAAQQAEAPPVDEAEPEVEDEALPNLRQQLFEDASHKQGGRKSVLAHRARRTINPFLLILLIITGSAATISFYAEHEHPVLAAPHIITPLPIAASSNEPPPNIVTPVPQQETIHSAEAASINLTQDRVMVTTATKPKPFPTTATMNIIAPTATATTSTIALYQPVDEATLSHQPAYPEEKWIEVDISTQQVIAWVGNVPVMSFIASTGRPETPTVLGAFRIYWKQESALMTGPDYYLPEVPYTMYFYDDYGFHGTYWHDNFGQPMSHGCVNLRTDDARQLFEWAGPIVPEYQTEITSSWYNPGTLVIIHE